MEINYQDIITYILTLSTAQKENMSEDNIALFETCFWGIQFGENIHDEILLAVNEMLEENGFIMERNSSDSYRK